MEVPCLEPQSQSQSREVTCPSVPFLWLREQSVQGQGFRVKGLGFRVSGFGLRVIYF